MANPETWPEATSDDVVQRRLHALRDLFPEVFHEDAIDFDTLRSLLGDGAAERPERFSLVWQGKERSRLAAQSPSYATLRPEPNKSVEWDLGQNCYIEGDNLEVLKLLQKSYYGRVKMIFIDPPYNTGKDFVYPDNYRDSISNYLALTGQVDSDGRRLTANPETGGRYHSDWLSMMFPRLKLARNLLRDDGVIFISIDDCEVANLRELCDEVFGEENFVANVVWQKKYTRANDAKWFSDNHDHILCYARSKDTFVLNPLPRTQDQEAAYSNPDANPKGPWKATPLHAKSGTNTSAFTFGNGVVWKPPVGTYRRFNDASMIKMDEQGEIWFGSDGRQVPQRKSFLSEVKAGVTPVTIWPYDEVGHNHEASNELKDFGLGGVFSNPKPTRLIRRMIVLSDTPEKDGIVLDFFGGSSTTAHAVLAQNADDGGTRRFILVQLPEPCPPQSEAISAGFATITDIGRERIRRVVASLNPQLPRSGYRALRLDSSNLKLWDPEARDDLELALRSSVASLKSDRNDDDLLFELLIKYGLDLSVDSRCIPGDTSSIYVVAGGALIVVLGDSIEETIGDRIAEILSELQPEMTRVVLQDSAFPDDVVKTNTIERLRQAGVADIKSL